MNLPNAKLTREEEAQAEMARTSVSPRCATGLTCLFAALMTAVMLFQGADDWKQFRAGSRPDPVPAVFRVSPLWSETAEAFADRQGPLASRVVSANRALLRELGRYETRVEEESWLSREVLPPAQYFFIRHLRVGNEKVYYGRKGHLFYRPDVDFVAGRGFLHPRQMRRRLLEDPDREVPVQPDPVAAIVQFNRELAGMGIRLIVVPVPAKPTLHPKMLDKHYPSRRPPPQNPSFEELMRILQDRGVAVLDCDDLLLSHKKGGYLEQDTHWLPSAVEITAEALARWIRGLEILPERPPVGYTRRRVKVAHSGDTAAMLKLPKNSNLYGLDPVRIHQVFSPDRRLWVRDETADVLLLGDSFTNIYSMPALNWGVGAGLAEQLSYYLQRPVDRITMNDNGAYSTRLELARRILAGEAPLEGKRVVVWQFAARELAQGDWRIIPLQPAEVSADPAF